MDPNDPLITCLSKFFPQGKLRETEPPGPRKDMPFWLHITFTNFSELSGALASCGVQHVSPAQIDIKKMLPAKPGWGMILGSGYLKEDLPLWETNQKSEDRT